MEAPLLTCVCLCVSGLLASVPSTNGSGNGGMMVYSPGEQQQQGTNSSCEWPKEGWREAPRTLMGICLTACLSACLSVPSVSGSSVATPNGSGSILLNFDHGEQSQSGSGTQQRLPTATTSQQQGGLFACLSSNLPVCLPDNLTAACCRCPLRLQPDHRQQCTVPRVCCSSAPRFTHLSHPSVRTITVTRQAR